MLTKRENFLETIRGGNPDRFVNMYEYMALVSSPVSKLNPRPIKGGEPVVNAWGIWKSFPENTPGPFPVHTPDKIVVKDIENWRDYVKVPKLEFTDEDWAPYIEKANAIDRKDRYVTAMVAPGIFEQCHYLCEIQNTLMYFYTNPDEMHELIDAITDYELALAEQICSHLHPDALFHHDDWGSQTSTFISPDMFREFYKPAYQKVYGYYKQHGVEIIVHHSDSYAATIVPDMIDMGIDVWQGVMRSNNIKELIEKYGGQISFMGGIDSATVDHFGYNVEEIRMRTREACDEFGHKYYIPCTSQGGPDSVYPEVYGLVSHEIEEYSKEVFK